MGDGPPTGNGFLKYVAFFHLNSSERPAWLFVDDLRMKFLELAVAEEPRARRELGDSLYHLEIGGDEHAWLRDALSAAIG
jgi:hypothetical protein